ncbi:MAG: hypothetical protein ACREJC_04390, partial [Tepidisphaeraceae bacterium]
MIRHAYNTVSRASKHVIERLESRVLMAAGALDTSFSGDGKATLEFSSDIVLAAADVAVQADGKTVIVGKDTDTRFGGFINDFAVARLNLDGTPDVTFGTGGRGVVRTIVGSGGRASANCVAIQPDGKILVAGVAGATFPDVQFAVVRYLPNGSLDTSFDGDGTRLVNFRGSVLDIVVQNDGKIVLVGGTLDASLGGTTRDFAIARLNPDGKLDGTFDDDGKKQVGFGGDDQAEAVAIDSNGRIVVVGGSGSKFALTRLNPDGDRDGTFNQTGEVLTTVPGRANAKALGVIIQSSGRIVVAGTADGQFVRARYLPDGRIDQTFGGLAGAGFGITDFGGLDEAHDLIQSADGGLIVAGRSNGKFALAAFTADGLPNSSFGTGGKVVTEVGSGDILSVALAKGPGRRFVVAGGTTQFKTARYLDAGANVVAVSALDRNALEGTGDNGSLLVGRVERLPTATRVFFNVGGTAVRPFG